MQLKATCGACGSDLLQIPDASEKDQMVRCSKCNADVGEKSEVQRKLKKAAEDQVEKIKADLINSLKKAGFK